MVLMVLCKHHIITYRLKNGMRSTRVGGYVPGYVK